MTATRPLRPSGDRITKALHSMRDTRPELTNLINGFGDLIVVRAQLKEEFGDALTIALPAIDAESFQQGAPVTGPAMFVIPEQELKHSAARLLPAMKRGFPNILTELTAIERGLISDGLRWQALVISVLENREEEIGWYACQLEVSPRVLRFVASQVIRPSAEKRAELIGSSLVGLAWSKGYCPICGSWPSLSILGTVQGDRTLTCSFCAHEWRFPRPRCPFCGDDDQGKRESIFAHDRPCERAHLCYECGKYIVELDLRGYPEDMVIEAVPLGTLHLDILAQQRGFRPRPVADWHTVDRDRATCADASAYGNFQHGFFLARKALLA